ncbi:hypothetical protein [Haloarchaeobius amylolyticus]|uniref:hypothetical protein n=1 Tax=Haloarchaeobius amylolyticus TaxID=1198296 RepID=UPI00226E365A|nr:hypothetical protein [Haloarchaeobius amylolyticus]
MRPHGAWRRNATLLTRTAQVGLVGVFVVGMTIRNVSVVLNALLALGVTFLPAVLERDLRIELDPRFSVYLGFAVFLHAVGMFQFYDEVWWWDHLTHTLSASIVAVVGYATVWAIDSHSDRLYLPRPFVMVFVLAFTLAMGVFWEVLEFVGRELAIALDLDPVLVLYGLDDTMLDLVFNLAGALVVTLFGTDAVREQGEELAAWLDRRRRETS